MRLTTRFSAIRERANEEPALVKVIADALGWETVEVGELLAGEFDLQRSEAKVIARAVTEFDHLRSSVVGARA
jgi:hypothetical protein